MTSRLRRGMRQTMAEHDWLEIVAGILGGAFLLLAVLCVYAFVVALAHIEDIESGFPAGQGFVQGMKGFGLVFFPVLAVVSASVGWFLVGEQIRRGVRRLRRRPGP
jgi:hypothetical protein